MKERPILFNGDMVRAILAGRKTQTRRVMKPIPAYPDSYFMQQLDIIGDEALFYRRGAEIPAYRFRCPFGQPGDRLRVRETWYYEEHMHDITAGEPDLPGGRYSSRIVYRASQPDYPVNIGVGKHGWRPSIHMPRWASRITLEVTDVRVQRLQEITDEDAIAEGFAWTGEPGMYGDGCTSPVMNFFDFWDVLSAKRGLGCHINPWVWAVSFKVVTP